MTEKYESTMLTTETYKSYFDNKKIEYSQIKNTNELLQFLKSLDFGPSLFFYYKRDFSKFELREQNKIKEYSNDNINQYLEDICWNLLTNPETPEDSETEEDLELFENIKQEFIKILGYLNFEIIKDSIEYIDENQNDHNIIFHFIPLNLYLGTTGYSWSDQRTDFDDEDEGFYEVTQVEKTIIVWEKK